MSKKEEDIFESMENAQGVVDVVAVEGSTDITPLSPGWSDYVMSHFHESELFDGRPTVAGLRRVAALLVGKIILSVPVREHIFAGNGRSAVAWSVQFEDGSTFGDVADCSSENTDDMYVPFALATAATRAEGRALRKALNLRTVAAEEVTSKNTAQISRDRSTSPATSNGEVNDSSRASDRQLNYIDSKCKSLNINVDKFLEAQFKIVNKKRMSKEMASKVIDRITVYQNGIEEVPTEVLGYTK